MKKFNTTICVATVLFAVMLSYQFATAQQAINVAKFPTTATNVQTNPTGKLWANPQNVVSLNNGTATVSLANNGICTATKCYRSSYLQATNYGFNLTTNDSVVGIEIKIRLKASVANSVNTLGVRPVSPNNIMCCTGAGDGCCNFWPTQYQLRTYGGPNETWGIICCSGDTGNTIINSPDFGMRISVQNFNSNASPKATIDYVRMTVYYISNGARLESQTRVAGDITESWRIYPNPVANNLQLKTFSDVSNALVKVFNMQGQLVLEKNIGAFDENESGEIETVLLSKGVYLLQIYSEGSISTKKFIRQ